MRKSILCWPVMLLSSATAQAADNGFYFGAASARRTSRSTTGDHSPSRISKAMTSATS